MRPKLQISRLVLIDSFGVEKTILSNVTSMCDIVTTSKPKLQQCDSNWFSLLDQNNMVHATFEQKKC
jgi:hypothetical protein